MSEDKTYTVSQAQYIFAVEFHRKTWELLEKTERTPFEEVRMLDYAHASLAHWRAAGTAVRQQRGEWLVSRVHAVLGDGAHALKHAILCYQIIMENRNEMEDFDYAFAFEAIARAYTVSGEQANALKFIEQAQKAGESIKELEERDVFFTEFNGGDWHGIK